MKKELTIEEDLFRMAFECDRDYAWHQQRGYLDSQTSEVLFVSDYDGDAYAYEGIPEEENRELRELVTSDPERYIEIPSRDHHMVHDCLREFLDSDWTDDRKQKIEAASSYNGSVGRWLQEVDNDAAISYYAYRQREMDRGIRVFMDKHGIEPKWC